MIRASLVQVILASTQLPAGQTAAEGAVTLLADLLVIKHSATDNTVAVDLFRWLIDASPSVRRRRTKRLFALCAPLRASNSWIDGLLHEAGKSEPPSFADLPFVAPDAAAIDPVATSMIAGPDDISPILFDHVGALAGAAFGPLSESDPAVSQALSALARGMLVPARDTGMLGAIVNALESRVADMSLQFVRRLGTIRIDVQLGPDGPVGQAESLLASVAQGLPIEYDELHRQLSEARELLRLERDSLDLHLESSIRTVPPEPKDYVFSRLGTGSRRWVCGAIDEAARALRAEWSSPDFTLEERRRALRAQQLPFRQAAEAPLRLRLIDSPVDSLEPRVHGEVLRWLADRVSKGESLVIATHQPSVLQFAQRTSRPVVIGVHREDDTARASPLGPNLMSSLQQRSHQLGVSPTELLFTGTAVLLVEGSDDKDLLQAMYGEELRSRGVFIHALGGSSHRQIVQMFSQTPYGLLQLPTWVLLDSKSDNNLPNELRWHDRAGVVSNPVRQAQAALPAGAVTELPFEAHDIAAGVGLHVYRKTHKTTHRIPSETLANRAMQSTDTASALKSLMMKWVYPDETPVTADFSKRVLAPVIRYINDFELGAEAASVWMRSAMGRLFAALDRTEPR